jgi:hypothetical protein
MKKAMTMPTTAREMEQRLAPLPLHRRLRAVTVLKTLRAASDADSPRRAARIPNALGVTGLTLLRSLRRDSLAAVNTSRRAISTASSSVVEHLNGDVVFSGWLCVEHRLKREFRWRFCVLDDALLTCYKDETPGARVVREHAIAAVERLTQLNRTLVLVGQSGYRLWVHVDHEPANLEQWYQLFAAAVDRQARRRDGSIFLRKAVTSTPLVPAALTGWMHLRKTRLAVAWLWSRSRRMYCVLTGTTLAGFIINMEGRWADFYGHIAHMNAEADMDDKESSVQWIELRFENMKTRARLAAVAPEQTRQWRDRIRVALKAR